MDHSKFYFLLASQGFHKLLTSNYQKSPSGFSFEGVLNMQVLCRTVNLMIFFLQDMYSVDRLVS